MRPFNKTHRRSANTGPQCAVGFFIPSRAGSARTASEPSPTPWRLPLAPLMRPSRARSLIDQLDAVVRYRGCAQLGEQPPGRLGRGIEHGVAIADVGLHPVVVAAAGIPQVHAAGLARPPTVAVAVAVRQEAREHSVLGVEDRQVVMRHHLEA